MPLQVTPHFLRLISYSQ